MEATIPKIFLDILHPIDMATIASMKRMEETSLSDYFINIAAKEECYAAASSVHFNI